QVISPSLFDVAIALEPDVQAMLVDDDAPPGARFLNVAGPDGEPLRVIARVERLPQLEGRYLFLVGVAPTTILAPAANLVGLAFTVFVAFCAIMVAAVTALQVRIGLEPLHELQRDIASVRRGDAERL